ncbi:MAG TPA: hypothetical protein VFD03_05890 [Clostridia bacterium]|nr:hypothetical protein [Clostridia bacterium]
MPRYNVNYKNKWACFSSVVDGFVSKFMDGEDYDAWRKCQYGNEYIPIEHSNQMTMKEAVSSIRMHDSHDESVKQLIGCGISQEESEKLIYDIETEYYVPVLKENGKFECQNCGSEVEKGQIVCNDDSCELEFVWR